MKVGESISHQLVSGLKINFAKSSFGAIGKSEQWKKVAAKYLNCRLLSIPFIYLGIPIGTNPSRCELWDPIIKKCERKLAKSGLTLLMGSFGQLAMATQLMFGMINGRIGI